MTSPHQDSLSLSVRQASLLTSLSEWDIRELVNKGEIQARRRGRRILIDHAALVTWFRSLPTVTEQAG
jgi:excisionase family DNA binding protein